MGKVVYYSLDDDHVEAILRTRAYQGIGRGALMKGQQQAKFTLQGLSCANCAGKIENEVIKIVGITNASSTLHSWAK